ncbi:MAG TPA: hypothetical protein VGD60_00410 [Candidatus Acidoferrales bacterium]
MPFATFSFCAFSAQAFVSTIAHRAAKLGLSSAVPAALAFGSEGRGFSPAVKMPFVIFSFCAFSAQAFVSAIEDRATCKNPPGVISVAERLLLQ